MKTLCKLIGGSHLYSLANENSDIDYRGIFCNTEVSKIIGLDRFDCQTKQSEEEDSVFYEVRHFLSLLRKTNTQVLEILFAPDSSFLELDDQFKDLVLDERYHFIDTKRLFSSIMGYMNGEKRLISGERKGQIGKKRYESVKKFGYSPKNMANYIRLALVASTFFNSRRYVVDCNEFDEYSLLRKIREAPESFDELEIEDMITNFEQKVKDSFNNRDQTKDLTFDEEYANFVLSKIYKPYLL